MQIFCMLFLVSIFFFLTTEMYMKLKLKNYNVMIKIDKEDLIDIIDIKKYKIKPYILSTKFCKKMQFDNLFGGN